MKIGCKLNYLVLFFVLVTSVICAQKTKLEGGLYAELQTTKGNILLQLEFEKTPITVANFVSLVKGKNTQVAAKYKNKPFFDGLKFHRVIKDFMIQGGDPLGTGEGNAGYKFRDEFNSSLKHHRAGTLSMANSGPATNGSQFFITHKATKWLDNKHTVFGYVVKGQNVVDLIEKGDLIKKVKIICKGKKAKKFKAAKIFDESFNKAIANAKKKEEAEKAIIKNILDNESKATVYDSGLKITTITEGLGKKPVKGDNVKIHYSGYLRNGKKFDSSVDNGKPFKTIIGVGRVIKGWDEGVQKLRVGTKAILYIPAKLAYGSRGAGEVIPPNADIIFEVELLDILE